jgi:hypothetical protein
VAIRPCPKSRASSDGSKMRSENIFGLEMRIKEREIERFGAA